MPTDIPVNQVLDMLRKGLKNEEVSRKLESQGYSLQQISNAMDQANIKQGVERNMPEEPSIPDAEIPYPDQEQEPMQQPAQNYPAQYQMPPAQPAMNYEEIQATVEQIVEEKWKEFMKNVGDINVFKARVGDDMEAVKQEILRTQRRLEDLQNAMLGKVKEYNQSVMDMGSDMKALEQVFSKILEPLTTNVKELSKITESLRKK